jgi:hypothetical protein
MNKLIGMLLFVFATTLCFGSDVAVAPKTVVKKDSKEELLFVMFAKDCYLKKNKTDNTSGTITLYNVSKKMTYFTDRPYRKAGQMETEKFIDNWHKNFKNDPPNASFVCFYSKKEDKFSDVPVELHNPRYDSKNDRLIFDIKTLEKGQLVEDGHYGEMVLFIDYSEGSQPMLML